MECSVRDTGPGILAEDLPKLFNKFEQFGREMGSSEKGTGLGLAICKGIVELHGGKIWAESQLGYGTKVAFQLPKLTVKEWFRECFAKSLKESTRRGEELSVILFEIKGMDAAFPYEGPERESLRLQPLHEMIRHSLRRKADMAALDAQAVYLLLPNTGPAGAAAVAERIKLIFQDKNFMEEGLEIICQEASFPADGAEGEELIYRWLHSSLGAGNQGLH